MKGVMVYLVITMCVFAACTTQTEVTLSADAIAVPQPTQRPTLAPAPTSPPEGAPDVPDQEPVAYVPAGRPGSAQAYDELVDIVPSDLRNRVPWPDLRNPNPIVAQFEIFNLWIWMAENLTEPQLVEIMAAPGSPSRESVVSVFGNLQAENIFEVRPGQPYEAFDHLVVTFESAGLPLWLGRDVPADAVVVYYSDNSGPVSVIDQDTQAVVRQQSGIPTRAWLSVMVPTDVGWQLWRDQLIEPNDAELQTPDIPPMPGNDVDVRPPEL